MAKSQETEKVYMMFTFISIAILLANIYYFAHPLLHQIGWTIEPLDVVFRDLRDGGVFKTPSVTKLLALALIIMSVVVRSGKGKNVAWKTIFIVGAVGLVFYLIPFKNIYIYLPATIVGYCLSTWAFAMIGRNMHGFKHAINDLNETFEQCDKLIETEDSINLPIEYQWKQKLRKGWINIVAPFRATMVMGTPGSGKSFAVYEPIIEQMLRKGYTMFCYDYKYPDLSRVVYNELMLNEAHYRKNKVKMPRFCVVNFKDPRYSMRCNPLNPKYIKDPADATEIAENILMNISPDMVEKKDFFGESAIAYISANIILLKTYENGKFCTFPHLIEMMTADYKKIFSILLNNKSVRARISPFVNALEGNAQDQLQGQLASAQMPLIKMDSPALYWVLSGNDFDLHFNNPDDPKVICIGNDPDRQIIYGTVMALYTFMMFKIINHKGNRKSGVLLDELPTVFIKGLDNLIATARSNKVAIVVGAQDRTQLIRDYKEKEAKVILNTIGNLVSGQVNGETAESISKMMGKEWREEQSQTQNIDSESISLSYRLQELMPASRIETLSQGHFIGKVADNFGTPIERKFFAGKILVDLEKKAKREAKFTDIPMLTDFGMEEARRQVETPYVRETILRDYCLDKVDERGGYENDEERQILADDILRRLSASEKKKVLDDAVEEIHTHMMEQAVEDNYDQIKQDIIDMLDELCPE